MGITVEQIERINELYRKSKTVAGLNAEEAEEQKHLRNLYIQSVRANLKGQLDNIDIKNDDGSVTPLRKR